MTRDATTISRLLAAWRHGERDAVQQLMPLVYQELRAMAHRQFRGNRDGTLQTTALVHEAYLKLAKHSQLSVQDPPSLLLSGRKGDAAAGCRLRAQALGQ